MWFLAVLGVLTSVVGLFYYLRVIKVMFFDPAEPAFDKRVPPAFRSWPSRQARSQCCFYLHWRPSRPPPTTPLKILFG